MNGQWNKNANSHQSIYVYYLLNTFKIHSVKICLENEAINSWIPKGPSHVLKINK